MGSWVSLLFGFLDTADDDENMHAGSDWGYFVFLAMDTLAEEGWINDWIMGMIGRYLHWGITSRNEWGAAQ